MTIKSWLAVLAAALGIMNGWTAGAPPIKIPVGAPAPVLDGSLDDPAWTQAAKIEHLYQINSDTPAPETAVWLLRDNAWLYVGAQCRNSQMDRVAQLAYEHDGPAHTDESLELMIRPTADPQADYYHFIVNFAGVMADQRCREQTRDRAWNPPWRAVVARQADGWTAELAIPLYCLGADDLGGMSLNIGRTLAQVDLDAYGAKHSERRVSSALRAGNRGSYHARENFTAVAGLQGVKVEMPFAPRIREAKIAGVRQAGGTNIYCLQVRLEPDTPVSGKTLLEVREDSRGGERATYAQPVEVAGAVDLTLEVPAGELREQEIRVH